MFEDISNFTRFLDADSADMPIRQLATPYSAGSTQKIVIFFANITPGGPEGCTWEEVADTS